ncbi:hypothetical protein ISCGN_032373 [Ixodes scapularis]
MEDRQRADRPSVENDSADELDTDKAGEPSDDNERQDHEADGNARWSTLNYKKPKPAKGTRIERFDLPKTVVVLKPREQIRITDISPKLLLDQIRAVLIVPCNRDRLSNVVNPRNNTIAVTVYDERHARDIMQLKALVTDDGRIVEVCAYRSVTGTMPRGVIHGMQPETTAQDIVENSDSDYHNIIHARPIGKKGTFLLTFDGEGIPRKINYHTRLINVYTYRPTAVICLKCHGFGHKAAVCTGQQRCKKCGVRCLRLMASTYVHQTAGLHLRRDSSKTVLGNCSDWVTDAVPLPALHSAWVKGPAHAFYALSPAIMCRSDMRQ